MVSTGKLRVVSKLCEGPVEYFDPTVSEKGQVRYPEVDDLLTRRDGTSIEVLNSLAERGILHQEYTTKVYVCPSCQTDGMQYITACPFCEATHTIRTTFFTHEHCDYMAESREFEIENEPETYYCPDCEDELNSSDIDIQQKYLCNECGESFDTPNHRLWCLDCLHICSPTRATEQTLYKYELSKDGENWYEIQTEARELLANELTTRGFKVDIDTNVQNEENESYPVHIYAEDELLNQQIVADIHSTVNSSKFQYISTIADEIQAQPLLLISDDSISDEVFQSVDHHKVILLWIDQDGSIRRYEPPDDKQRSGANIIDRLSSAVGFTP